MHTKCQCFALSVFVLLAIGSSSPLASQTVLERLESQIRQRVAEEPGQNASPASARPGDQIAPQSPEKRPPSGYLGVLADDRQDRGRGVRILDVYPGSPGEKAGLRKQDLITAVGDLRVRQMSDLADVLAIYAPGEVIDMAFLRGNAPQTLKVTLGSSPEKRATATVPREMIPPPPAQTPQGELPVLPPQPRSAEKRPGLIQQFAPMLTAPQQRVPEPPREPDLILPPPPEKPSSSANEQINLLLNRIQQLEQRVQQLERELAELKKKP